MADDISTKGATGTVSRRLFLTGGLSGATAAAVAVTVGEAREEPEEQVKPRYQETAHVQRFYDMNRI